MPPERTPARVALIPYLNSAPFFLNWDRLEAASEGRWSTAVLPPRQLGQAAEAGKVDAGLLAVADLIRLEASFEPLLVPSAGAPVSFGIANRERVESVLLFARRRPGGPDRAADLSPEDRGHLQGARIAVTSESSTSFRLLRLLLEVRHGVRPVAYPRMELGAAPARPGPDGVPKEIEAALVIGDLALRWRHRPPEGFAQRMDLAAAWFGWTGLPFVFARWGVRRSLPEESKLWLGRFLEESLRAAEARIPELVRGLPAELGTREDLAAYLKQFIYRLGPEELGAQARFRALLQEHRIACTGE